ncbi:phosphatase PAP2 family protein [Legionella sp. CNM-1927-20]|uniref:phosphatase PAP2 family protein n=1 Tax=Legionella sp. CNM-1927-20 TaxID=3422221 RepID=UPI00403A9E7A
MKLLNFTALKRPDRACSIIAGLLIGLLSSLAFYVNSHYYHYIGNNYFPPFALWAAICLFLILIGLRLQFGNNDYFIEITHAFAGIYLTMLLIALATNAAQYSPFPPIDKYIVALESQFYIDLPALMAWTNQHPNFKLVLGLAYDSLAWQMGFSPLLVALLGQFSKVWEYFCLLLISAIIGFTFYYFFPTTAPASILKSPFFLPEQYITGIKFMQIHNHQQPTSLEGGMVALPSFHFIWAWLCLYIVRGFKLLFIVMIPINFFLALACILLGWHYPLDLIGSVLVLLIAHFIYNYLKKRSWLNQS